MSDGKTIHSRLRVLVAKTFKAEKLYSAIRNVNTNFVSFTSFSPADVVNQIRSAEWQNAYRELRTVLNEVLNLGAGVSVSNKIVALRDGFRAKAKASYDELVAVEKFSKEALDRHEFGHLIKLSCELVRLKSACQAFNTIEQELNSILESSGRVIPEADNSIWEMMKAREEAQAEETLPEGDDSLGSNVVPFRKKMRVKVR